MTMMVINVPGTVPDDRRVKIAEWLTANGVDPNDVLLATTLVVVDGVLYYERTVRDDRGGKIVENGRPKLENATAPITTPWDEDEPVEVLGNIANLPRNPDGTVTIPFAGVWQP